MVLFGGPVGSPPRVRSSKGKRSSSIPSTPSRPGRAAPTRSAAARSPSFGPRDGRLFALDNRCPHRGGPLSDGIIAAGTVICPSHGWKFELETGRCLHDAASVRSYPVLLVDGRMILRLEGER